MIFNISRATAAQFGYSSLSFLFYFIYPQAWRKISESFNSQTRNGAKTIDQLKIKWKNLTTASKGAARARKLSLKKTGGGPYEKPDGIIDDAIDIDPIEVDGLENEFDSDAVFSRNTSRATSTVTSVQQETDSTDAVLENDDEVVGGTSTAGQPTLAAILTTPGTGNALVNRFARQPRTPRAPVVVTDPEVFDLRKRKLQLEVKLLERQIKISELDEEEKKLKIDKLRRELGATDDRQPHYYSNQDFTYILNNDNN